MRTPCEVVVKYMLPAFRSYVAKVLINEYHLSQTDVSKRLGTTQAAISHYISSKRGSKKLAQFESVPMMRNMVMEIAKEIASGNDSQADVLLHLCNICKFFRNHNILCDMHKDIVLLPNKCDVCVQQKT
ncbi:MAG: hypothetical protein QXL52_04900 [Nitrososphaerales archaeon]